MSTCIVCGKELTTDATLIEGLGPVCRAPLLVATEKQAAKMCAYEIEFIDEERILIIHEKSDPEHPTISLTNCIEFVINKVVKEYGICTSSWTFVEHSSYQLASKCYTEYDIVVITGRSIYWRYLWHSDAKGEKEAFTKQLIIERVKRNREVP